MIKGNYHTHTYRCKHASGEVSNYAREAVNAGLQILGISDHTALPNNKWLDMRMDISELEGYIKAIDDAKKSFPQLTILKGMECEYLKEYHSFYSEELLGKHGFDYLSASAHFYPCNGEWMSGWGIRSWRELKFYAEYVVEMMATGLFDFVAHPDMFGGSYDRWDADADACSKFMLQASEEFKIPLEINAYGFRKGTIQTSQEVRNMYPWEPFWELASQYNILVTVNSDAHHPEDIVGRVDDALSLADKYGLKVVESPQFCRRRELFEKV